MRALSAAAAIVLMAVCHGQPPPRGSVSPPPSPPPSVSVRAPAEAILDSRTLGAPAVSTDGLTPAELAASAPDQVVALEEYRSWGWAQASHRRWASPGLAADDLVILTDRDAGARRAFAYLAQQASAAPLRAGPCPPSIAGLDDCGAAADGARTVVVGRLGAEVFVLDVSGADGIALAAEQAARLRAT